MKHFFIYVLSFVFFISCADNNDVLSDVNNIDEAKHSYPVERLTFSSIAQMDSVINELDYMGYSRQKEWSRNNLQSSILNEPKYIEDTTLIYRLNSLKSILNKDLEFQIKDSIFWYHNDAIYYLSLTNTSKQERRQLKDNPEVLKPIFKYYLEEFNNSKLLTKMDVSLDGGIPNGANRDQTTFKQIIRNARIALTNDQLEAYENEVYVKDIPYPQIEKYKEHAVSVTLFCERREDSRDYIEWSRLGCKTYKIYFKISTVKKTLYNNEMIMSYSILNPLYSGYFRFNYHIEYDVYKSIKGMGGGEQWYSSKVDDSINIFDLSEIGNEVFIYQTGDNQPSGTQYISYNFKIDIKNLSSVIYLYGTGSNAQKVTIK